MAKIFETQFEKGSFISRQGDVGVNTNGVFKRTEKGLSWYADGTSYLDLGTTLPTIIKTGNEFSVVVYFKTGSDITTIQALIGSSNGTDRYIFAIEGGIIRFSELGGGVVSSTTLQSNTWYCVIFTNTTGNTHGMYLNSILQAGSTSAGAHYLGTNIFLSGAGGGTAILYTGYTSKFTVYDHILTEKERAQTYNEFLQAQPLGKELYPRYNPFSKASDLSREVSLGLIASYNMISQEEVLVDTSDNDGNGVVTGPISTLDGLKFDGIDDTIPLFIEAGIAATVKTVCFRIKLDSTTEQILEGGAGSIFIFANAGTLTYADYDNAYIDGVETDTIAAGQWTNVVVTSSTAVSNVTATLGLNDTSYGAFEIEDLKFYSTEWILQQAKDYHNSFAKRISLIEDFTYEKVGETQLEGTIVNSGTFELKEDSTSKYFECLTNGSFSYGGIDLSVFGGNGWVKTLTGDLEADEGDTVDNASSLGFSGGALTVTMTAGDKLRKIIIVQGEEQ